MKQHEIKLAESLIESYRDSMHDLARAVYLDEKDRQMSLTKIGEYRAKVKILINKLIKDKTL